MGTPFVTWFDHCVLEETIWADTRWGVNSHTGTDGTISRILKTSMTFTVTFWANGVSIFIETDSVGTITGWSLDSVSI